MTYRTYAGRTYAGVCAAVIMLGLAGCGLQDFASEDSALVEMENDAPVPDAAPAYVGVWGANEAQCANLQEVEDAPMIMTQDGYDQYEAHCGFETVAEMSPGVWRVDGHCSVQGDAQDMTMEFSVDGDQLHFLDAGEAYASLQRCTNADAGLN